MSSRIDRIRRVRSSADALVIISDIAASCSSVSKVLSSFHKKRGSTSLISVGSDESIQLGGRGVRKTRLSNLAGIKLDGYKSPKAASLAKYVTSLKQLHENEADLNTIEATLKHSFASTPAQKKALAAIQSLRKELNTSLDKVFDVLNNIGVNYMPKEMVGIQESVSKIAIDMLDGMYESVHDDMDYVVPGSLVTDKSAHGIDDSSFVFSHYIQFLKLRNSSGFVFDSFFVILSGVVTSKGTLSLHLNAFPNFITPGHYPLGKVVHDEKDIKQRLGYLLSHNDIATGFERKPMPIDRHDADQSIAKLAGVRAVRVTDDELKIYMPLNSSSAAVNKVVTTIMPLLQFKSGSRTTNVQYKTSKTSKDLVLTFILTRTIGNLSGAEKKSIVDAAKVTELRAQLGLTEEQASAVRKALKPHA